ncbi:MAG: helix-turn-helix domain-containing protein [Fusobacteriaceae bacterium]
MTKMTKQPKEQAMFTKEVLDTILAVSNIERKIVNDAVKKLGNLTSVKEIAKYLSISKSAVYNLIDTEVLFSYKAFGGTKIIIFTESIINVFRS